MSALDRQPFRHPAGTPGNGGDDLWQAAQGLVDLLSETALSLDQRHYVDSLKRIIASGLTSGTRAAGIAPPPPMQRPEVDMDVLRELRSFLPETSFRELTQQFDGNVRRLRDDLVQGLANRDVAALEFTAHAMIGAVGAFGLRKLATEARKAVTAAREKRGADCIAISGELVPQIEPALSAVSDAIRQVIGRP